MWYKMYGKHKNNTIQNESVGNMKHPRIIFSHWTERRDVKRKIRMKKRTNKFFITDDDDDNERDMTMMTVEAKRQRKDNK